MNLYKCTYKFIYVYMAKIVLLLPLSERTSVKCHIVFFHSCFYACTTHYEHFPIQKKKIILYIFTSLLFFFFPLTLYR